MWSSGSLLTFWFRLLSLTGVLSILMAREGWHSRRTWREEEDRWSCTQDPSGTASLAPLSWVRRRARASRVLSGGRALWRLWSLSLLMFECVGFSKLPFLVGSPPLCFSLLNLSASSLPFPPTPGTRRPRRGLLRGRDRLDRAANWYPFFLFPSVFVSLFVLFCFSLSFLGLWPPCYGLRARYNTNRIALIESKIWMGSCIDCSLFFLWWWLQCIPCFWPTSHFLWYKYIRLSDSNH